MKETKKVKPAGTSDYAKKVNYRRKLSGSRYFNILVENRSFRKMPLPLPLFQDA